MAVRAHGVGVAAVRFRALRPRMYAFFKGDFQGLFVSSFLFFKDINVLVTV